MLLKPLAFWQKQLAASTSSCGDDKEALTWCCQPPTPSHIPSVINVRSESASTRLWWKVGMMEDAVGKMGRERLWVGKCVWFWFRLRIIQQNNSVLSGKDGFMLHTITCMHTIMDEWKVGIMENVVGKVGGTKLWVWYAYGSICSVSE